MISFLIATLLLIGGYFIYGKFISNIFGVDKNKPTPAVTHADGVDFVPLPAWRIFLIQFLNIAGLGPIFGAIMGAMFGTASFLWIVFGSIFAGATHDYLSGMISLRKNGQSLTEIVGSELGVGIKMIFRCATIFLLILVGAVFISGPAGLLSNLTAEGITSFLIKISPDQIGTYLGTLSPNYIVTLFWITLIFIYYVLATLLPVDKIIGKIYPVFGAALLFMAVGIFVALIYHWNTNPIPEVFNDISNHHPAKLPIFPMMFISIACGAISGFHATQSPMMARCLKNEKHGRPIFFGAMIAEGMVALIWAAATAAFFGGFDGLNEFTASLPKGSNVGAVIANKITNDWLGSFGAILAMLGIIAAPITSGDTALRSARLTIADMINMDQKPIFKRLLISIPLFICTFIILQIDFQVIWRYFAWSNQTLAVFTLWATTVYLAKRKKLYIVTLIPAIFMTMVCSTYILVAQEGLQLPYNIGCIIGGVITISVTILFLTRKLVKE